MSFVKVSRDRLVILAEKICLLLEASELHQEHLPSKGEVVVAAVETWLPDKERKLVGPPSFETWRSNSSRSMWASCLPSQSSCTPRVSMRHKEMSTPIEASFAAGSPTARKRMWFVQWNLSINHGGFPGWYTKKGLQCSNLR